MKANIHSNVIVNLIRTVAMTLLSFITFPFVCRILGDSALGTFTWVSSFVYYFIVLSKISIPNIAIRECAKVKDNPEKLSTKIQEFFILQAIMTLLSFVLMCIIVFSVPSLREGNTQNLIFILSINFLSSVFAFEWVFTALEKQTYLAIRSIIILAFVDILIFTTVKYKERLPLYTFLTTLVTVLTVVSNLIYLPRLVKFKKTERYNFKQYIPELVALFVISFALAIYAKTDSFILGIIDSSKSSVGSYSVGMKGVDIVIGIIIALGSVFMPRASYYYSQKDTKNYANLNKYSSNICFIIVIPAIALMSTLATPITSLISGSYSADNYKDTAWVLIALCSLMLTYSLANIIYTQILIPQKREKIYLFVMLAGAALNIGLSILFGVVFMKNNPAIGIALATSITDLLILVALLIATWPDSNVMIFNFNNLKIVILGIIIGLFSYFVGPILFNAFSNNLSFSIEMSYLCEIGIIFIGSVFIYLVGLIISKEKLTRSIFKK